MDLLKFGIDLDNRKCLKGKGFDISYVQAGSGPTGDETALVKYNKNGARYYILNGDWVDEYKPLVKRGYKACKKFFDEHKDGNINFWSN